MICHHFIHNWLPVILFLPGIVLASELIVHSPVEFADDVAEAVATGPCGTAEEPIVLDRATLIRTLVGFPGDFLDGLVPVVRFGHTSYPISVQLDATTGTALFRNAEETVFYTIAPPPGSLPLASLLPSGTDPAGVVIHWRVLPQSDEPPPRLRSMPRLRSEDPSTNLCFTAIDALTNGVSLTLAWPTNAVIPDGVLDLYFAENLQGPWDVLRTVDAPATNATASVFLTPAEIPSYTNAPPPHVHEASCMLVTNIAPNIFSGGVAVTNVRWSCSTNRTFGVAPAGFFQAGTRHDTDGDGLPDAFESIVSKSSRWLADSDGDGLSDYQEIHTRGTNPLLADTDGDGLDDWFESHHNLSATSADTDGDGLDDFLEIRECFTSATDVDSDNDGLSDADEILIHGTSPFATDTDGDGISDFHEIEDFGSNPLSWDTDGDGMDDYEEHIGSDYGLDILDPSDASADYDGDGVSNLNEIQDHYSHISRASSNAVPRLKLLRIYPLEFPHSDGSSVYAHLPVLGDHPTKGARIRIPRSTQLATTNVTRVLHYTDAPGIWIGNQSLAGGGTIVLPDTMGSVEFPVHSTPGHGGATATLTLEGANIVSPNSATFQVPKMTKAELRLSNALTPVYRTNLVNGVLGTFCTGHYDPDYGMPRFYLTPTIENDNPTGHRSLKNTDLVLVKVSGATNLTTTANYLRWDGVHHTRRGQELPVGISRVEAGLDFDFDGELDDEEVAVACDVHVARIGILTDTDRNGAFGPGDFSSRTHWTHDAGALLAVDDAPIEVAASRAEADSPLSPFYVLPPVTPIPDSHHLDLQFAASPAYRRLYAEGYTNALTISSAYVVTQGLGNAEIVSGRFYHISSTKPAVHSATNPEATLELRLRTGNATVYKDTVTFKLPPLIVPWNTLPLTRLWTCDVGTSGRFPATVAADRQMCLPRAQHGGCQWVQDMIQTYAFQKDTANGWQTAFADTGHRDAGSFPQAVVEASATNSPACLFHVSNSGDGGNVEATPPLPGYPYGRLLTGTNSSGNVCTAVATAEAQGLQGPAIKLPVGWLAVGHVDEVCCFIGERTVMVPSPRLAFDLIAQEVVAHNGNYTNTIVWGDSITNYIHRMQDILFDKVITNANWATDLTATDTTLDAPQGQLLAGDVIYCDDEIIKVKRLLLNIDEFSCFEIERGIYATSPAPHSSNTMLLLLSTIAKWNLKEDDVTAFSAIRPITDVKQILSESIPDIVFVEVPLLYTNYRSRTYQLIAGTPNMVNAVVDETTVYMTDPGCDLFRDAVNVPGKVFVGGHDVWSLYHCLGGELHCGSEVEREIPASPPWWQVPEFENWPYEKKGVSP